MSTAQAFSPYVTKIWTSLIDNCWPLAVCFNVHKIRFCRVGTGMEHHFSTCCGLLPLQMIGISKLHVLPAFARFFTLSNATLSLASDPIIDDVKHAERYYNRARGAVIKKPYSSH